MVIKSVYLDERKFIDRQIIRSGTGVPMDKNFKENIKTYYNQDAARRNRQRMRAPWKRKVRKNFYKIIKQENKKPYWNWVQVRDLTAYFLCEKD